MPIIKIDGIEINVEKGTTIIEAAKKLNINIPVFCYHEGLSIAANCRMCLVEVEVNGRKFPKPMPACHTQISDGMIVLTNTDKIKKARKGVLEFLFLNHPIDCPICDQAGECSLQDYYVEHGLYDSRLSTDKVKKTKAFQVGKNVMLDSERCVLCARCVRFTREITKTNELAIFNRGNHSEIGVVQGKTLDNDYSVCAADVCPVGALTSKDFRFKKRVWYLSVTNSVCNQCSNGCNITIEHENGVVYRYKPRENQDVNKFWMCDFGRLSYKELNENRLYEPKVNGNVVSYSEGITKIFEQLKEFDNKKNKVAIVVSASTSLENAFAIKYFFNEYLEYENFYMSYKADGKSDDFLIKKDKNPNRKGVKIALSNLIKENLLNDINKYEVILFFGSQLPHDFDKLKDKLKDKKIIAISSNENELTSLSHIIYPVLTFAEQNGIFINEFNRAQYFNSIMNKFKPYNPTVKGVKPISYNKVYIDKEFEVINKLSKLFNTELKFNSINEIMALIKKEYPFFNDFDYKKLPVNGLILEGLKND